MVRVGSSGELTYASHLRRRSGFLQTVDSHVFGQPPTAQRWRFPLPPACLVLNTIGYCCCPDEDKAFWL